MAKQSAFVEYVVSEVLMHIPGISVRFMFGGYGVYKDVIIFGIIDDDVLYLKVDEITEPDFRRIDSKQFSVVMKGKSTSMNYWSLPEHILEDREAVEAWIGKAVAVSLRAKKT